MPYSEEEKIILKEIRKRPRIHYNELEQKSGLNKKTFENHLRSLEDRGKITHYEFERKKHFIAYGKNTTIPPLSYAEKIEWNIAWKVRESQEFFDSLKGLFAAPSLDESGIQHARFVFENILQNVLSLTIHDALLDPENSPHRRFMIKYKKLIKDFFEIVADQKSTKSKKSNILQKNVVSDQDENLFKETKKFELNVIEANPEPFADEISRLYSETTKSIFQDTRLKEIFIDDMEFSISSLILDHDKIKNLKK